MTLIDMAPYIKENCPEVQGWSLKPLAMLFSKFQEIIFLDSDVLFFHDPNLMYNWKLYKSTGALYFRDRTLPGDWIYRFTDLLIPEPSVLALQNRVFNRLSVEEGESGVIVMDKHRGGTFVLLLASLMNMDPYRTIIEKNYRLEGDKETFWTANEMLKLPYAWGPGAGGSIGYHFQGDVKSVCGCLYHSDEDWNPSWFNGGLVKYKWADEPELMEFTHIGVDRSFTQVKWYVFLLILRHRDPATNNLTGPLLLVAILIALCPIIRKRMSCPFPVAKRRSLTRCLSSGISSRTLLMPPPYIIIFIPINK